MKWKVLVMAGWRLPPAVWYKINIDGISIAVDIGADASAQINKDNRNWWVAFNSNLGVRSLFLLNNLGLGRASSLLGIKEGPVPILRADVSGATYPRTAAA
ncbi:hypothetical protein F0562_017073 [Nyssa sinensis]|uniref:Uncharacterized protein n=1 Tax=Nyssa sinensis TaxID=561372 RepID=A0A5J4ZH38_9ASTE|nr:hypothetical protein F0562_017073 [Nyssa sinensis]